MENIFSSVSVLLGADYAQRLRFIFADNLFNTSSVWEL